MKYKLIVILGVFLVSFAPIFVKQIDVEPSIIAMYRLGIGGILLLPFALTDPSLKKVKLKEFGLFAIAGFVISIHYISWFTALELTSVTSSTLIICTQPLVALAFGYALYRDKISKNQFLLLLVALIGVGFVASGDFYLSQDAIIGDLYTFIAVVFYVVYLMIGKQVVQKYSFLLYTSFLFLSAAMILFVYNIINQYPLIGYSNKTWLMLVGVALIPNAGQLIFNYALKYVKSSLIATSILLEPIFATILAVIILKDQVFTNQLIGGAIILSSVYFYIKKDKLEE